jgi:hypothetical protein
MPLSDACRLHKDAVESALGGLPPRKAHGALLAISTLRKALAPYTGDGKMP